MIMTAPIDTKTSTSNGGRLVTTDGRELPLQSVHLAAEAGGGIARVVLTQRFKNPFDQPLEVRYLLPLPSDGAVSGFSFVLGDQRVVGEVTGKQAARERFHQAMVQGRTAALLEQERTSLFAQRVGNVPPHCEVVAEVIVDQPLRWLEEGAWEWRFPTVVAPRYQGAPGRVADAARLSVPMSDAPLVARTTLSLTISDALTGAVESPSHSVETRGQTRGDVGAIAVQFEADGAARLDRDVVVSWPVALPDVSCNVLAARPETAAHDGDAFALLTIAPPTGGWNAVPRDLTFLIDTSGSMGGRPLEQAKRVVALMIDTLGVNDRLELIEFGSSPRRWQAAPAPATESNKQAALKWVQKLSASGGTEMHRAVLEALKPLRPGSQRQVVLLTDGLIGFEQEIVRALLNDLPAAARLHSVGVGGAVNRSLTQAVARAGRGTELIVGLDEDAERVVGRLVARTTAPIVTDLVVEGAGVLEVAPRQLPDLYAEAPALISTRLSASGGELVVRGRTADGPFERRLQVPALSLGQGPRAVAALFAREKVEDLEMALTASGDARELNATIEATGIEFQISTRLTSWIAVSKQVTVAPDAARLQVEQAHELPHGVSVEGLGLRAAPARQQAQEELGRLGDYKLLKRLAEGGMGTVYLAERSIEQPREKEEAQSFRRASRAPEEAEYLSSEEALDRLQIAEEELKRLVSQAELRGVRDESEMKFKAGDVEALLAGRGTEATTILNDSDQEFGIAERSDELILEDSTASTEINIGDLLGGERAGSAQKVSFEATKNEEYAGSIDDGAPDADDRPITLAQQDAESIVRRLTTKRVLPRAEGAALKPSRGAPSRRRWLLLLLLLLGVTAFVLWFTGVLTGVGAR